MTTPDFVVAIPARFDASRLPGKPLRLLAGEPLVLHVARRALAAGAREVWVAADDERIVRALEGSGVQVARTATTHASGTDRRRSEETTAELESLMRNSNAVCGMNK